MKKEEIKALLLQMRKDAETLEDEVAQFIKHTGLKPEQFDILRLFEVDDYDMSQLKKYDVFFSGGSSDDGDALLVDTPPKWARLGMDIIRYAYENKKPTFLSCFGFQAGAVELGGDLIYDEDSEEFGTLPFTLTEEAKDDALYRDTPNPFYATVGHKKYVTKLPKGAVNLAKTDMCQFHSFKFTDRPFYAFQFHPELTKTQLIEWLTRYKDRYFKTEEEYQKAITGHVEVPEANALLGKFIDRVVLAK